MAGFWEGACSGALFGCLSPDRKGAGDKEEERHGSTPKRWRASGLHSVGTENLEALKRELCTEEEEAAGEQEGSAEEAVPLQHEDSCQEEECKRRSRGHTCLDDQDGHLVGGSFLEVLVEHYSEVEADVQSNDCQRSWECQQQAVAETGGDCRRRVMSPPFGGGIFHEDLLSFSPWRYQGG